MFVKAVLLNTEINHKFSCLGKVYGLARSIIASGTLLTLLFNDVNSLFVVGTGIQEVPICNSYNNFGLFCISGNEYLSVAKIIAVFFLTLVIIGWRPRYTAFFHWWITFSFYSSATVIDGSDQIANNIALLLIPICLCDHRKWVWKGFQFDEHKIINELKYSVIITTYWVIKLQVAVIYLHAGVAKLFVEEWGNGTAIYYWLTHPTYGLSNGLDVLLYPIITSPMVALISWSVLTLEIILFSALFFKDNNILKSYLMVFGIVFHFFILLFHGLFSFFFTMSGALLLYLFPLNPNNIILEIFKNIRIKFYEIINYLVGRVNTAKTNLKPFFFK